MDKRILLPSPMVHPRGEELLEREVEVVRGAELTDDERARVLPTVHGIYGRASADDIAAATALEVAGSGGSGVDWIDVEAATARGVLVINAAGAQYPSVAEHAVGLLLSLAHRIGVSDRLVRRERRFPDRREYAGDGWPLGRPHELRGRTLGVLGFGFIGREVARLCREGLRMTPLAYDPYADPVEADRLGVTLADDLDGLLAAADAVVLCLPLTDATHHLVDESALRAMGPGTLLVNVSRGPTVDQAALTAALTEGRIAGAGLDVFEEEPLPADSPLYELDNVVLTPHIGGWTAESLPRLAETTATEMLTALRGERPRRLVNPEAWPAFQARRRG